MLYTPFCVELYWLILALTMFEDVPLVEFMSLVFRHMPGESYRKQLRSLLLRLCDIFRVLINSLECVDSSVGELDCIQKPHQHFCL